MGLFRNLAVVALFAGAYASNPDESSFQRYVEDELKRDGSTWLERKVISHIAANMYKRNDYLFFSTVTIPDDKLHFVGLFGNWFKVPSIDQVLPVVEPTKKH